MSVQPEPSHFLFTDIESSIQLWERCPETMQQALRQHDELLRQAVEALDREMMLEQAIAYALEEPPMCWKAVDPDP